MPGAIPSFGVRRKAHVIIRYLHFCVLPHLAQASQVTSSLPRRLSGQSAPSDTNRYSSPSSYSLAPSIPLSYSTRPIRTPYARPRAPTRMLCMRLRSARRAFARKTRVRTHLGKSRKGGAGVSRSSVGRKLSGIPKVIDLCPP
ncbi:hypothetical protein K438DRAFT_1867882 [Mycena galopus ATCC 62051]|nr:hypothetical protein K438DRAFT_1867882 [Mycena galopus ATCC 62051]